MDWRNYINYAANTFGADPNTIYNIAQLESSFRPDAQNDWDSNAAAGTPSYGIMQFIQPTFNSFYDQAYEANPEAFKNLGPKNWRDPRQQILVASHAIANGNGSHWATYDRARAAGGSSGSGEQPTGRYAETFTYKNRLSPEAAKRAAAPSGGTIGQSWLARQKGTNAEMSGFQNEILMRTNMRPGGATSSPTGTDVGAFKYLPRRPGETGQQYLDRLAATGGLRHDPGNSQTTGGQHSAGSDHYVGKATDYGDALNDPALLDAWANFLNQNSSQIGINQVLWQDGGDHDDHVHASTIRSLRGKR